MNYNFGVYQQEEDEELKAAIAMSLAEQAEKSKKGGSQKKQ